MNSGDMELLAKFVAQRLEMGETEWFLKPELLSLDKANNTGTPSGVSEKVPHHEISGDMVSFEGRTLEKKPYDSDSFSDSCILEQKSLDELYTAVCGCKRCPLGHNRKKFVFGSGNSQADIMFIGEAPGADEDMQGLPFVGRAGRLLTKMIEAVKLRREDVYIGNILKCRPPGNRDPNADEIDKCEPIFIRQIEIIKPKIIFALGRISGQTLLRSKSPLNALRGKLHDYHGVKLIVSYHPAALLRNNRWKPAAWEDLKFLRREYDGLEL